MIHELPVTIAYIDPGTGSLLLQGLGAMLAAVLTFFWNPIISFFRRFKPKSNQ